MILTRLVQWTIFFICVPHLLNCRIGSENKNATKINNINKKENVKTTQETMELKRDIMVKRQLQARDIVNEDVLKAMQTVERHKFVPEEYQRSAYDDGPLPIGYRQTISQPYIVAYMTQALNPQKKDRVLEIGTGSGYQAAVLSVLVKEVYTIEIVEPLCEKTKELLKKEKYENIKVKCGDGYKGWPEAAPFDLIILTAAPSHIPQPLIDQLAPEGRLIAPVGSFYQELILLVKDETGKIKKEKLLPVRFVPMTGEAEKRNF
ncbi:MAG: protein-L-isoaspartate(D-aspartate) O-methyltransferase [Spirochaetia bacterium]|nr:protein-L-isoaspartate(D-aspartate) O-methyltransferase [Spirochaetia bacterium]